MPELPTTAACAPLTGLRAVSMAELYPGPFATALMSDLGAEVVIVERPNGGDPSRQMPGLFSALNRGKQSVTVDLKSLAGPATIFELMRTADFFFEGFRPGTLARFGLGYEDVAKKLPHLIYVSISGFGQSGPYRDRPAHDISYQALAGLLHSLAGRREVQVSTAVPIADLSGGLFAVVGALAALHSRQATGCGCHVDLSMSDGLVSMMMGLLAPVLNGTSCPDPSMSPSYGLFACADGVVLSLSIIHEDGMWRDLCDLVGEPSLRDISFPRRIQDSKALRAAVARKVGERPAAYWSRVLSDAGIPHAVVADLEAVTKDPHFRTRGMFVSVPGRTGGEEWHVRQPLAFGGVAPGPLGSAPRLGEHNDRILGGLLGRKEES